MNLIDVCLKIKDTIQSLEEEKKDKINKISEEYDRQIDEYKQAFEINRKLNTACIYCNGTGEVDEGDGCSYESRYIKVKCGQCYGTGIKHDWGENTCIYVRTAVV